MKRKLKFFIIILSFLLILFTSSVAVVYAQTDIDITSSSVRDDLESMEMDKLSYLSDTENIFITMSQYYDNENNLRSYLYFNYIGDVNERKMYVELSTAVMDSNYNITENYQYYELSFVNQEETWCKYEILNLPNLNETTRRYNISSIGYYVYTSQANIYTHIINEIGQTFIYNGITNETIQVFHEEVETITITDKEVAFYCYGDGDNWWFQETTIMQEGDVYTDSWFIFFNTDKKIDELLEIELTYTQYDYHFYRSGYGVTMDSAVTEELINDMKNGDAGTIYPDDFESGKSYVNYHNSTIQTIYPGTTKVSYSDKGWFGKYDTYYEELDNIMNLKEYQAQDSDNFVFTDYANNYAWGVHFKDTTRQFEKWADADFPIAINLDGSGMSDVAILRLKFKTDGIIKNCYAIDTPTSDFTGNSADVDTKYEEWFERLSMIVGLLMLVVLLGYLSPIFSILFKGLITALELIFKGVITIISLPFKLIAKLLKPKNKKP